MGRRSERAALDVVGAAYRMDEPEEAWLQGVASAARPMLDHGLGAFGATFRVSREGTLQLRSRPVGVGPIPQGYGEYICSVSVSIGPAEVRASWGNPLALDTASATYHRTYPDRSFEDWQTFEESRRGGIHDNLAAKQFDPTGLGCIIIAPLPRMQAVKPRTEARWRLVMAHVMAGLRLREHLRDADEAILGPGGQVLHAEEPAKTRSARETLREAAKVVDRAKTRAGQRDPDAALQAWRGLVSGRWSLIDRFDSDGRRFVIARRNDPSVPDPRALSERERQVLAYAALGHSNKRIAYALGLSPSTISTHLRSALRRLGQRDATRSLLAFEDLGESAS